MGNEKTYKNLAVIFPGIGYHTDKPLLYYGKKLAAAADCRILEVSYGGFAGNIKGNKKEMEEAFCSARAQAEKILQGTDFDGYDRILFISKSIGTVVAAEYACRHGIPAAHIYFTPLEDTFSFVQKGTGVAFHGTKDPWADTKQVEKLCCDKEIPLFETQGANHSLETGDVNRDIANLGIIMGHCREYLESEGLMKILEK